MPGFGNVAKAVFGAVLLVIGIAIVAGVDKQLEAALVEAGLASLTTRFCPLRHHRDACAAFGAGG